MVTRLQVSGFKNLVDVDVRFGPFTCIAGGNGVGKSNLFDAIVFLSRLASSTLLEAASFVRDPDGTSREIRSLFTRAGDTYAEEMQFGVEMVVAPEATDDLGQRAKATHTILRYDLVLGYEEGDQVTRPDRLVVRQERLNYIKIGEARQTLPFLLHPRSSGRMTGWQASTAWRKSAVQGGRRSPYISMKQGENGHPVVQRHQEGNAGSPQLFDALHLPRTVLSTSNAVEGPTALIARREMESWSLLHFEPTALRRPDDFFATPGISTDGGHVPVTLFSLANQSPDGPESVYASVANRLSHLIDDVRTVSVERDPKREILTLLVEDRNHTHHTARALSDGTLRFLALSVLQEDPDASGVWCLEEPENGLYPARVPAMIELLRDIAMDTGEGVGPDNPLRQVIINTHSPGVVQEVPESSLVAAVPVEATLNGEPVRTIEFKALSDTWRTHGAQPEATAISKAFLIDYLNLPSGVDGASGDGAVAETHEARVMDRPELRQLRLFPDAG